MARLMCLSSVERAETNVTCGIVILSVIDTLSAGDF